MFFSSNFLNNFFLILQNQIHNIWLSNPHREIIITKKRLKFNMKYDITKYNEKIGGTRYGKETKREEANR